MPRTILLLALSLTLAACQGEDAEAPEPAPTPLEAAAAACAEQGGSFGRVPGTPEDAPEVRICYREPADANTPCRTANDCEGACLARSMTCAPVIPLLGCNDVITASGVPVEVCID